MEWALDGHVLQALFWSLQFALFVNGYSIGSRSVL